MKKLLLGACTIFAAIFSANAQTTIQYTNFGTTIPAGWTQQSHTVDAGWQFGTAFGSNMQAYAPAQGDDAYVDDWDNNSNTPGWDTLKTNTINCSADPYVFVAMNYMFWVDDGNETSNIIVSTNGGHTWSVAAALSNTGGGWADSALVNISQWAGSNATVMIGITYYNGYPSSSPYTAVGMAIEDFDVYAPVNYDVQVASQNLGGIVQVGTPYTFSGVADNWGGAPITSMNMNYSVNRGPVQTQAIAGISGFNGLTSYNWSMPGVQFTPGATGLYTVRYWANNLNGANVNTNTDTLVATFWAIPTVETRQSLYEEQTGQSCVYCMLAAPNMDSVSENNVSTSNIIRYHVPIPARDFMYDANETPVNARESYYGITGAPWGNLDGVYFYPGALETDPTQRYSSYTVQTDNAVGSPFKIDITSAKYIASKDSFYVSANITAEAAFNAGLTAQVVLTIDSVTYQYDLSQDNPLSTFAPPLSTGTYPDYLYEDVLKFTHVAEEMFPNTGNGTSLAAFTTGQTQTVSFGWKKNHPWGDYDHSAGQRDSDFYDSSSTGQFVVFVQTNSAIAADGIPAKYVFQSANAPVTGITALGISQISNDAVSFEMYPNPTNNNTTLAFNLNKDQTVNIEVYNMLGEKVYSDNQGMMSSGQHTISINGSTLQNGIYFVRFIADNVPTTQKLVIQK